MKGSGSFRGRWRQGSSGEERAESRRVRRKGLVAAGALVAFSLIQPPAPAFQFGLAPGPFEITVGHKSRPQLATIRSMGWGPLTLREIRLTGKDTGEFELDGSDCLARPVPPGQTCVILAYFAPLTDGPKSATLAVTAEGISGPPELPLSGVASLPNDFELTPPGAFFDPQAVGSSSDWKPVGVHNLSGGPLRIEHAELSGEAPSDFEVDLGDCATMVARNGRCRLNVRFHPAVPGVRSAVAMLKDSTGDAAHDLSLSGEGIVADLSVDPPQLFFPGIHLQQSSKPLRVTVVSEGGVEAHTGDIQFTGEAAEDFGVVRNTCNGLALPKGAQCELEVVFAPKAEGPRRATLSLGDDAFDGPHLIEIEGTGIRPQLPDIQVSASVVPFGIQPVRARGKPRRVVVFSRGEVPLHVGGVGLAPGGAAEFNLKSNCSERTLAPNDNCIIEVYFAPREAQEYRAQIAIPSDAPGGTRFVELEGTGYVSEPTPVTPPTGLRVEPKGPVTPPPNVRPATPSNLQPGSDSAANPQVIACDDSMFRWDAVAGAGSYRITVGLLRATTRRTTAETTVYANEVKLSPELVKLEPGQSYAWTVTAIGSSGQSGDAAAPRYIRCIATLYLRPGVTKYAKPPQVNPP